MMESKQDLARRLSIDTNALSDSSDFAKYKFVSFAKTNFQNDVDDKHTKGLLEGPLLALEDVGDQLAALAVWATILRYTGDMEEPKKPHSSQPQHPGKEKLSIYATVYSTLSMKFSKQDMENLIKQDKKENKKVEHEAEINYGMIGKLYSLWSSDHNEKKLADMGNPLLPRETLSDNEKVHFIITHCILRPNIRDEVYCQLSKHLTDNPDPASCKRAWNLMALCVSCFPPSKRLLIYLSSFLKEGPPEYAARCKDKLERTLINGVRKHPPSLMELQNNGPIKVQVTYMDGHTKMLLADSATTAGELSRQLSEKIDLVDKFGFCLYVAVFDQVTTLESGDHIMDIICQCEQFASSFGFESDPIIDVPWKMFFRKEMFSPWYDATLDPVATSLIYQQIVRGVKFGEYRCDNDEELALIAAKQYYIDYGPKAVRERMLALIPSYIPDSKLQHNKDYKHWDKLMQAALKGSKLAKEKQPVSTVQESIVDYAKGAWALQFSSVHHAFKFSGPRLLKNNVMIAINWKSISALNEEEEVILELSYPEILSVSVSSIADKSQKRSFTILTIRGDEYRFVSPNSQIIHDLVVSFLEGLRRRSKYAVALKRYVNTVDSTMLELKSGDLIIVDTDSDFCESGERRGTSVRTGKHGNFLISCAHILPTTTEPSAQILAMFTEQSSMEGATPVIPHTLEQYSDAHFSKHNKSNMKEKVKLWRFTKDQIKRPLHQALRDDSELSELACKCFEYILKYITVGQSEPPGIETVKNILEAPLKRKELIDEIYCQILKQLTANPDRLSEERGWELMWLTTGCLAPSTNLLKEVTLFLRSRSRNQVAVDCIDRMKKTSKKRQSRKYPPHQVELDAIRCHSCECFHKVYFPDGTNKTFEASSSMSTEQFCRNIATSLNLESMEGFGLSVHIDDQVVSGPGEDYYFDYINHMTRLGSEKAAQDNDASYLLYFVRKVWLNVAPGKDGVADLIFHFYQEQAKYLQGYHLCSNQDAAQLGAYIYRSKFGDDKDYLVATIHMLNELVPADLVKTQSPEEWKDQIIACYSNDTGKTSEEARFAFLKLIYKWPTFGSAFFDVRVSKSNSIGMPEFLFIAINEQGVNFINATNKQILKTYPFTKILKSEHTSTTFTLKIQSLIEDSKLVFECETLKGHQIEDICNSYQALIQASRESQNTETSC